ncbi:MAG: hypothetical protein M3N41_14080, partial [Acidobacteriota bacterium]|nr:hypothetical protein [Acidobacteriota bacterium]
GRKDPFVYPVHPAPRTAVLVPWFHESALVNRPVRTFAHGWSVDAAAFAPAAVAGTVEQLNALAREGIPSLTHSIVILWQPEQQRMTDADRERLWWAFRVPLFEQVIGKSGKLLAAECEAHDGLHVASPALSLQGESVDQSPCPCGRVTPRIGVTHGITLQRRIAASAR